MRSILAAAALVLAATFVPSTSHAQTVGGVTITSDFCRNAWEQLRWRDRFRAMAISRDGAICHSAWGYASQDQADRVARDGCQQGNTRSCVVLRR